MTPMTTKLPDCSNAAVAGSPPAGRLAPAQRRFLFDVHIGIQRGGRKLPGKKLRQNYPDAISPQLHCCEVCRGIDGCTHWYIDERRSPLMGSAGTCKLYGTRTSKQNNQDATSNAIAATTVVLWRSDAEKLGTLTRCHQAYVRWLKGRCAGEAEFELLVDVTAIKSTRKRAIAETQLRSVFEVPAYLYTVEQIVEAFPAVAHWPSPESHDASRNKLKGDVVKVWWAKVLKKHRPALGPKVASRLISYLIHEPSLVLWARHRKAELAAAAPRGVGARGVGGALGARRTAALSLPAHVWVIEDDAVFMGDLTGFFRLFGSSTLTTAASAAFDSASTTATTAASSPSFSLSPATRAADFVSTFDNLNGPLEASSHDWKTNRAFATAFGNRRVHKWEHVERYSARLIQRLDELLSTDGVAAHGEMFGSTVCLASPWCVASDLRLANVVAENSTLYGPSASALSTSERWERRALYSYHAEQLGAPGVWIHSIKNFCNALALASNDSVRVSADDPNVPFILGTLGMGEEASPASAAATSAAAAARPSAPPPPPPCDPNVPPRPPPVLPGCAPPVNKCADDDAVWDPLSDKPCPPWAVCTSDPNEPWPNPEEYPPDDPQYCAVY